MTIATLRKEGCTAVQIGEKYGVSEKTVRRTNGWKNYKSLSVETDKTDKTDPKTQNLDIEIDIEKEKDIDKDISQLSIVDRELFDFEYDCFLQQGLSEERARQAAFRAVKTIEQ